MIQRIKILISHDGAGEYGAEIESTTVNDWEDFNAEAEAEAEALDIIDHAVGMILAVLNEDEGEIIPPATIKLNLSDLKPFEAGNDTNTPPDGEQAEHQKTPAAPALDPSMLRDILKSATEVNEFLATAIDMVRDSLKLTKPAPSE